MAIPEPILVALGNNTLRDVIQEYPECEAVSDAITELSPDWIFSDKQKQEVLFLLASLFGDEKIIVDNDHDNLSFWIVALTLAIEQKRLNIVKYINSEIFAPVDLIMKAMEEDFKEAVPVLIANMEDATDEELDRLLFLSEKMGPPISDIVLNVVNKEREKGWILLTVAMRSYTGDEKWIECVHTVTRREMQLLTNLDDSICAYYDALMLSRIVSVEAIDAFPRSINEDLVNSLISFASDWN